MMRGIERNFLFIWVCVLLGIAIVLSLTFTGCSVDTNETSVKGKATGMLEDEKSEKKAEEILKCEDSDAGIDKEVKGTVTLGDDEETDECVGSFLLEYYCENGKIKNKNFRCDCSNGKCV